MFYLRTYVQLVDTTNWGREKIGEVPTFKRHILFMYLQVTQLRVSTCLATLPTSNVASDLIVAWKGNIESMTGQYTQVQELQ